MLLELTMIVKLSNIVIGPPRQSFFP